MSKKACCCGAIRRWAPAPSAWARRRSAGSHTSVSCARWIIRPSIEGNEMNDRIYFDNSATTPLDPRVTQAMEPYLAGIFGNPSSLHWAGREAHEAVEQARRHVAELFDAHPKEIVFTASGTEADNMALIGVIEESDQRENHLITR